jgi:hypothetical protein
VFVIKYNNNNNNNNNKGNKTVPEKVATTRTGNGHK